MVTSNSYPKTFNNSPFSHQFSRNGQLEGLPSPQIDTPKHIPLRQRFEPQSQKTQERHASDIAILRLMEARHGDVKMVRGDVPSGGRIKTHPYNPVGRTVYCPLSRTCTITLENIDYYVCVDPDEYPKSMRGIGRIGFRVMGNQKKLNGTVQASLKTQFVFLRNGQPVNGRMLTTSGQSYASVLKGVVRFEHAMLASGIFNSTKLSLFNVTTLSMHRPRRTFLTIR